MVSLFRRIIPYVLITLLVFIGLSLSSTTAETQDKRITIIISNKGKAFDEVAAGFQDYLQKKGIQSTIDIFQINGNPALAVDTLQNIERQRVSLIFTIGSLATDAAIQEIKDIPVIAGMVLKPEKLESAKGVTGVFLEYPVTTQFQWIKRFLPDVKNIGVLYNPQDNDERIKAASRAAQKMGLKLIAHPVHTPKELPTALDLISKRADALWGITDSVVLTPQTAKHILLFSFRNRIPFIGLSSAWVRAGALYSLEWDYTDISAQCGDLALRILRGDSVRSIHPVPPRKVVYSLNLKSAERVKVEIPDKLVKGAKNVF